MALNCNLDEEDIKKVKAQFTAWLELEDEKGPINDGQKEIKKTVAEIIGGKTKDATALFKAMKQLNDGGDTDLDEVGGVLECIRSNGSNMELSDSEVLEDRKAEDGEN